MNTTAVIYARVSSVGDRQNNERQIEDLKILGERENYTIQKIYEEKISGAKKNTERPVLTECLSYCFNEKVGILLISELSRLGRNVDEVLKNVMLCKERKLNVYFQKENLSIFDESGKEHPFLTIFIAILGTVSQMERENIKFRLNSGREMYKRNGVSLVVKPAIGNRKKRRRKNTKECSNFSGKVILSGALLRLKDVVSPPSCG